MTRLETIMSKLIHVRGLFPRNTSQKCSAVLVNTIPKAGTNLLLNILKNIPGTTYVSGTSNAAIIYDDKERLEYLKTKFVNYAPGSLYFGHIPYSKEISDWLQEKNIKTVFLYRDPRAVTVSLYHYIMKDRPVKHVYYPVYNNLNTDSNRLMANIKGHGRGEYAYNISPESIPSIKFVYDVYQGWLFDTATFSVRFEDLIGSEGIGTSQGVDKVKEIMSFLDFKCCQEEAEKIFIAGTNPKKSRTFRTGKIDSWREEYLKEHYLKFDEIAGDLLSTWGYLE